MATEIVDETPAGDEASYQHNAYMRGLSMLLGSKDVERHAIDLHPVLRERMANFFDSACKAEITHIQTLGKLLSGYDESYAEMPTLNIGWMLQEMADRAEAYKEIADACAYANRVQK